MFEFLNDFGNYNERKLGRSEVNGVTVSTAYTSDEGYETAIIDENGVHPVERYDSREDAQAGHEKWCKDAETIDTIIKLGGFHGLVDPEVILIVRSQLAK